MNPIKPNWKTEIIPLIFLVVSVALSFYFFLNFPEKVVSHWNFRGEADGWMPKNIFVLLFPALLAGLYLLFLFLPHLDPQKERYAEFAKTYHLFKTVILAALSVIFSAAGLFNLGWPINIGKTAGVTIGIMFLIMGKNLKRIRFNWFLGIRTPWTLSSETVWNKTHRLGGRLFMLFGLALMIAPFVPELWSLTLLLGSSALLVLGLGLYSLLIYQQEKNAR